MSRLTWDNELLDVWVFDLVLVLADGDGAVAKVADDASEGELSSGIDTGCVF